LNTLVSSTNGKNWSVVKQNNISLLICSSIAWNGSLWIATGYTNSIYTAIYSQNDLNNWRLEELPFDINFIASRRSLPYTSILTQPYVPQTPSNWPPLATPTTTSQALDIIAKYLNSINSQRWLSTSFL